MANFKASARSVDMLGRQQIAGIPNAINEIFKNAYDAYAKEVRADFIEDSNILFIRDNGYGMTRSDFEDKWLTLGTDSKAVNGNSYKPQEGNRNILGEKGIGRLSIATVGPSVLVVTRAERNGEISKIVTSYICWTLFEIPGISIDKIPIPVIESDEMPGTDDVKKLIDEVIQFYKKLKNEAEDNGDKKYKISNELNEKIEKSLSIKPFSPKNLSYQYINTESKNDGENSILNLDANLSGTHFYITPVDEMLSISLSKEKFSKKEISDLQKQLLGFYPVFLEEIKCEMRTSFNIYRKDEFFPQNILGTYEFFSPTEYKKADHHFEGTFDENGTFTGTVSIYGKKINYSTPWKSFTGQKSKCGSFAIRIGFFQGKEDESTLSSNDFAYIKEKLDRVGGLYIYKDNIRVLPYGDNDVDFLKLEKQRTLNASYYLFSLRRFIGAILLSNKNNSNLQEKAGREGFTKNTAYYDFISILNDFLESLLINFLREKSNQRLSDVYKEIKEDLRKQHSVQKAEEIRIKTTQDEFQKKLRGLLKRITQIKKDSTFILIKSNIDNCLNENDLLANVEDRVYKLESLKKQLLNYSRSVESELLIEMPTISLGEEIHLQFHRFKKEAADLLEKYIYPETEIYQKKIESELVKLSDIYEQERKFKSSVDNYKKDIQSFISIKDKQIADNISKMTESQKLWKAAFTEKVFSNFDQILNSMHHPITSDSIVDVTNKLEKQIFQSKNEISKFYSYITDDIVSIEKLNPLDNTTYSLNEALTAQGENLLNLKKQLDNEAELFQLGTAISIIHHEFAQTADNIKNAISNLSAWANANESLQPLYNTLNTSYKHLENYLQLFTPLNKRSKIIKSDIFGNEIYQYIVSLFGERAEKDSVKISKSDTFSRFVVQIDPSVILPVFINLVDNSMFWVKVNNIKEGRLIHFDIDGNNRIWISDNGPGFQELSEELIFTRGFTTKPGGRGLGLFISKQILNDCGYDIDVSESFFEKGAAFVIYKKEEDNE